MPAMLKKNCGKFCLAATLVSLGALTALAGVEAGWEEIEAQMAKSHWGVARQSLEAYVSRIPKPSNLTEAVVLFGRCREKTGDAAGGTWPLAFRVRPRGECQDLEITLEGQRDDGPYGQRKRAVDTIHATLTNAHIICHAAWRGENDDTVPDGEKFNPGFLVTQGAPGHLSAKLTFAGVPSGTFSRSYRISHGGLVKFDGVSTTTAEIPIILAMKIPHTKKNNYFSYYFDNLTHNITSFNNAIDAYDLVNENFVNVVKVESGANIHPSPNGSSLSDDGMHFDSEGYRSLAQLIYAAILEAME